MQEKTPTTGIILFTVPNLYSDYADWICSKVAYQLENLPSLNRSQGYNFEFQMPTVISSPIHEEVTVGGWFTKKRQEKRVTRHQIILKWANPLSDEEAEALLKNFPKQKEKND